MGQSSQPETTSTAPQAEKVDVVQVELKHSSRPEATSTAPPPEKEQKAGQTRTDATSLQAMLAPTEDQIQPLQLHWEKSKCPSDGPVKETAARVQLAVSATPQD